MEDEWIGWKSENYSFCSIESISVQARPNSNWFRCLDKILCKISGSLEEHIGIVLSTNQEVSNMHQKE